MAYGGDRRPPERLAVPVSLSRSGFPRIIPSFVRHKMYKRYDTADILVKCWLSLFSLARKILVAKRVGWMPPLWLPWFHLLRILIECTNLLSKGLLGSLLGSWKTSFMFSINKEITEGWSKSAKAKSCLNVFHMSSLHLFILCSLFILGVNNAQWWGSSICGSN